MSSKKVQINGVAKAVKYELELYSNEIRDGIKESAERVATEGKTMLQLVSLPSGDDGTAKESTRREWKKYSKGWQVKNNSGKNFATSIIHQNQRKGMYRLTHLLEYGHETRNGKTRTRAFKHIKPVEEYVVKQFEKEVEEIIKKGGK